MEIISQDVFINSASSHNWIKTNSVFFDFICICSVFKEIRIPKLIRESSVFKIKWEISNENINLKNLHFIKPNAFVCHDQHLIMLYKLQLLLIFCRRCCTRFNSSYSPIWVSAFITNKTQCIFSDNVGFLLYESSSSRIVVSLNWNQLGKRKINTFQLAWCIDNPKNKMNTFKDKINEWHVFFYILPSESWNEIINRQTLDSFPYPRVSIWTLGNHFIVLHLQCIFWGFFLVSYSVCLLCFSYTCIWCYFSSGLNNCIHLLFYCDRVATLK